MIYVKHTHTPTLEKLVMKGNRKQTNKQKNQIKVVSKGAYEVKESLVLFYLTL